MTPHPIVERSARGELPSWAVVSKPRLRHMERVAELLGGWADALGLDAEERARWVAVGYLHDALRDAPPEDLRARVPPALSDLPDRILHGPATAERLRVAGVVDGELLRAVAYHTLGHPELGRLGRALYAADFLEPGRELRDEWRAQLRARMPGDLPGVVRDVLGARIAYLVERGRPVHTATAAFWNALVERA